MKELRELIKGEIGRNIVSLDTVGSTNTYAAGLAEEGAAHGTVVMAESQTAGRGRMGRMWVSPPGGNLYMSVVLFPSIEAGTATLLTLLAGVACCRALRNITGLMVDIKWPNDLMIAGRKIGGILTEVKVKAGKINFAVVGVGINVNAAIEEFPPDVKKTATSLKNESGKKHSTIPLAAAIMNELDCWYRILTDNGREEILSEWRRLASTLGKSVIVSSGGQTFTGVAVDIDEAGRLILRLPSGTRREIGDGDLTVL